MNLKSRSDGVFSRLVDPISSRRQSRQFSYRSENPGCAGVDRAIALFHESSEPLYPRARGVDVWHGVAGWLVGWFVLWVVRRVFFKVARKLAAAPAMRVGRPVEKSIRTKVRVVPSVVPPSFLFFTPRGLFLLAVWFIHVVAAAPMHRDAQRVQRFTLVHSPGQSVQRRPGRKQKRRTRRSLSLSLSCVTWDEFRVRISPVMCVVCWIMRVTASAPPKIARNNNPSSSPIFNGGAPTLCLYVPTPSDGISNKVFSQRLEHFNTFANTNVAHV